METLQERLERHEGFSPIPYRDADGWSIGFGHYMGNEGFAISERVGRAILAEDIHKFTFEYESLGWDLDPVRREVCIAMIFWHGLGSARKKKGFRGFTKAVKAIIDRDWQKAHDEFMDSKSGREMPERMTELANAMLKGVWE